MTMPLTQEDVDKFRKAYQAETKETIVNQEAWDMATRVLWLAKELLETASTGNAGVRFDDSESEDIQ